jgi:hypothetical protein
LQKEPIADGHAQQVSLYSDVTGDAVADWHDLLDEKVGVCTDNDRLIFEPHLLWHNDAFLTLPLLHLLPILGLDKLFQLLHLVVLFLTVFLLFLVMAIKQAAFSLIEVHTPVTLGQLLIIEDDIILLRAGRLAFL